MLIKRILSVIIVAVMILGTPLSFVDVFAVGVLPDDEYGFLGVLSIGNDISMKVFSNPPTNKEATPDFFYGRNINPYNDYLARIEEGELLKENTIKMSVYEYSSYLSETSKFPSFMYSYNRIEDDFYKNHLSILLGEFEGDGTEYRIIAAAMTEYGLYDDETKTDYSVTEYTCFSDDGTAQVVNDEAFNTYIGTEQMLELSYSNRMDSDIVIFAKKVTGYTDSGINAILPDAKSDLSFDQLEFYFMKIENLRMLRTPYWNPKYYSVNISGKIYICIKNARYSEYNGEWNINPYITEQWVLDYYNNFVYEEDLTYGTNGNSQYGEPSFRDKGYLLFTSYWNESNSSSLNVNGAINLISAEEQSEDSLPHTVITNETENDEWDSLLDSLYGKEVPLVEISYNDIWNYAGGSDVGDEGNDDEVRYIYMSEPYDVDMTFDCYGAISRTYIWDDEYFSTANRGKYNHELAKISSALLAQADDDKNVDKEMGNFRNTFDKLGFKDVEPHVQLGISSDDFYLAHKASIIDGEEAEIVALSIRGTKNNTKDVVRWNAPGYFSDEHVGMSSAAKYVNKIMTEYASRVVGDNSNVYYWIVGHSQGGGIANYLAGYLTNNGKVICYTIASPNVAKTWEEPYKSTPLKSHIFNIINQNDKITDAWNYYGRFGKDYKYYTFNDTAENESYKETRYKGGVLSWLSNTVSEGSNVLHTGINIIDMEHHSQWRYNSLLESGLSKKAKAESETNIISEVGKTALYSIKCPVDVAVYLDDEEIIKIVNDEIISDYYAWAVVEDDKKFIYIPEDVCVKVLVTAYDKGKMTYAVDNLYKSDGSLETVKEYKDIQLTKGKVFIGEFFDAPALYVGEDKLIEVNPDGSEVPLSQKSNLLRYLGSGIVLLLAVGIVIIIVLKRNRKQPVTSVAIICSNCGTKYDIPVKFCGKCGTEINHSRKLH